MTFSLIGRCEKTNMVGVAISSSSISVAGRCPWVEQELVQPQHKTLLILV